MSYQLLGEALLVEWLATESRREVQDVVLAWVAQLLQEPAAAESEQLRAREAARLMGDGGRIIAITHAPGGRTGSFQPWVAMGSAKAALESLVRYFAVTLGPRGIR